MLAKELFYVNLSGSSLFELVALFGLVLLCALASRGFKSWFLQASLFCVPLCLSMTLLSDHVWVVICGLVLLLLLLSLLLPCWPVSRAATTPSLRHVLSDYRAGMMLATCIAILAVDFVVFPRRFAKTEEFGFSLMDLGVGSFLFSSGLVMKSARSLRSTAWECAIVLGLGLSRFVATWLVGYHEHVSEYGSHWNFFLTIGILQFVTKSLKAPSWPTGLSGLLGIASIGFIQAVYFFVPRVVDFMLLAPRTNLFSHNREGVIGLFGFWGVMLVGVETGRFLRSGTLKRGGVGLCMVGTVGMLLCWAFHAWIQLASRRLANAAYCLSTFGLNCFLLAGLIATELMCPREEEDSFVSCISQQQLLVFLTANLATGAINLSINTMETHPAAGFAIVLM